MVGAGLLPATVTINIRAEFWAKIFPLLVIHPSIKLAGEQQLAWATRNDSPRLNQLLDEFVRGHSLGTEFGNIVLRRFSKILNGLRILLRQRNSRNSVLTLLILRDMRVNTISTI